MKLFPSILFIHIFYLFLLNFQSANPNQFISFSLPNKLNVLYIRNPHSKSNSISLTVHSGVQNEHINIKGLAHLTEHMLFLGSKTYPNPFSFINYITLHEGAFNGYTDLEKTVFYYKIPKKHFKHSLHIFSNALAFPLFNTKYIHKEIHAVHNEHEKNIQSDSHRKDLIIHSLAHNNSLYHRFANGNKYTLSIPNIREKMVEYFNTNYIPEKMFLTIYGSQRFSIIKQYLLKTFNLIKRNLGKEDNEHYWIIRPFKKNETSLLILYETINKHQEMEIRFIIDPLYKHIYTNPEMLFVKLFDYKGKDSLSDVLINKGMVKYIKCSLMKINREDTFLIIKVALTENGLISIPYILKMIFAYIESIKSKMHDRNLYKMFKHYFHNKLMNKQHHLKGIKLVKQIAKNVYYYNDEHLIIGNSLLGKYNETAIDEFLKYLNIDNCIIAIGNKTFDGGVTNYSDIISGCCSGFNRKEKYGFAKYSVFELKQSFKEIIKNDNKILIAFPEMKLNKIIPHNVNLVTICSNNNKLYYHNCISKYKEDEKHLTPYKLNINNNNIIKAYFTKDRSFLINKTNFICKISFPYITPFNISFISNIRLYIFALYYKLRNYFFIESLKGTSFKIKCTSNGFTIELQSHSLFLQNTIRSLFHHIHSFTISPHEFIVLKDDMLTQLQSQTNLPPLTTTQLIFNEIIQSNYISINSIINYIQTYVTYDTFTSFINANNVYKNNEYGLKVTTFIHGSLNEETAILVNEIIIDELKLNSMRNCDSCMKMKNENYDLDNKMYVYRMSLNEKDNFNNAIGNYYEIGNNTSENYIQAQLIKMICGYIYFKELRLKKQLGYIIKENINAKNGKLYYVIQIQGSRKTPCEMNQSIEKMIKKMRIKITNVSYHKLELYKQKIVKSFKVKDSSLIQRTYRLWNEIKNRQNSYDNYNNIKEFISTLNKENLLLFFDEVFGKKKSKLSIQIYAKANSQKINETLLHKEIIINNTNYFRNKYNNFNI